MIRLYNLKNTHHIREKRISVMGCEDAPEHIQLAVELIRLVENLQSSEESALQAGLLMIQDTLKKMPPDQRQLWQYKLEGAFITPRAGNSDSPVSD